MSHEIEQHINADGTTESAFVAARIPAWHRLGTVFDDDLTADQVLKEGHLGGWNVHKQPVQTVSGLAVADKFATVRTNPFTQELEAIGGVVGNTYLPIQNEETTDLLSAVVDETHARFETAGSLRGGRSVFITMKLPEDLLIGGVDRVNRYLTLLNSHDGTSSLTLLDTPIRVVCANTESAALRNHQSKVSIWHTESARESISQIREALKITFKYDEAFEAEAEKMIQTALTDAKFAEIVDQIWTPEDDDEATLRKTNSADRRKTALVDLFTSSDTNKEIRGTRWAGYNAVTEYLDWFTPIGAKRNSSLVRAERTALPNNRVTIVKERAFDAFAVKAKAGK